jgi:putative transposase
LFIEKENKRISTRRQCELLELNRSNVYYKTCVKDVEREDNLRKSIDRQFLKEPCGVVKMMHYLRREGFGAGEKLIRRLMREMCLMPLYPKPKLSRKHPEHRIYPYLLKGFKVNRANQVWTADITYIQLDKGFCYLIVIMDWHSRYVISWWLSNSLDADFCVEALKEALKWGKPKIFNTDQGSQFTSKEFTQILMDNDVRISMDGRGRVFDNIFIERLWRTVKYENIFIREYQSIADVREGLKSYFDRYNTQRLHQGLGYQTPWEVYSGITFSPKQNYHLKTA